MSPMKDKIRVAMLGGGLGSFVGPLHRKALLATGNYELVAGCFSRDFEKSRQLGEELNLIPDRCYKEWEKLLERESEREDGANLVVVLTPNALHFPMCYAALEAGFDVVCDKPLTTKLEKAEKLLKKATEKGAFFGVTYTYTGYPLIKKMRQMVRNNALGDLRFIEGRFIQDWCARPIEQEGQKQAAWRFDPAQSGLVGCVGDIGTHVWHAINYVTGKRPIKLLAHLGTMVENRILDDTAQILLNFKKPDLFGQIFVTQAMPSDKQGLTLSIHGEKAAMTWTISESTRLVVTPYGASPYEIQEDDIQEEGMRTMNKEDGDLITLPVGLEEAFRNLYKDYARMIGTGKKSQYESYISVLDGVDGVLFMEKCVESSQKGSAWVTL